jgi:adenine phosphoribosyltransferase
VSSGDTDLIRSFIRDVPDFPQPGITFKDITPLLADGAAFRSTVDLLGGYWDGQRVDRIVGIESRGFILAAPIAYRLGAGLVPVRKAGKLPHVVEHVEYALEYGTDRLEIHRDALRAGERVLVIDDVLATGGTAAAAVQLVEALGAKVIGLGFILELGFLAGRDRLPGLDARALITY